ncbi:MAG: hypothetical protein Q9O24_04895 [Gammaproteobacteria bacterium]|nr:hypothetical protein [Gammaproteobacteria bacterium]
MSSVLFSRSLVLPVSAHKVVKVQALSRVVAITEQQTAVVRLPVETDFSGEYIALEKPDCAAGSARILSDRLASIDKKLDFYLQHQALEIRSRASLGLNIDCLL